MKYERVIIAPNAYKGALSATEAAKAIKKGLIKAGFTGSLIEIPIADGGDGSLDVVAGYLDMQIMESEVRGPLGKKIPAKWGFNGSKKLAVIEMAEASGLKLLSSEELNPMTATSFGTGQLIMEAINKGAQEIYLTVGGSASVDLGVGILESMGIKFYSANGIMEKLTPQDYLSIVEVDLMAVEEIKQKVGIHILSDVTNPLLGEEGAAAVFGPQKGADTAMVYQLEDRLSYMADLLEKASGKTIRDLKGGGAAGGVTAGLYAALGAEINDGAERILSWAHFDDCLEEADLLITGEGKIDTQTNYGKGPGLVARKAKERGIRVIGLSGALDDDVSQIKNFDQLIAISDPKEPLEVSMKKTAINLEKAVLLISDS